MEISYNGPESEVMVPGIGVFPRRKIINVSEKNGKMLLKNPNFVGMKLTGDKK